MTDLRLTLDTEPILPRTAADYALWWAERLVLDIKNRHWYRAETHAALTEYFAKEMQLEEKGIQ